MVKYSVTLICLHIPLSIIHESFDLSHNHGECDDRAGWLMTTNRLNEGGAGWERTGRVPMFLYSPEDYYANWNRAGKKIVRIFSIRF